MIYQRILELAKEKGYSIRQIEGFLGYSNATIRNWRKHDSPPVRKLKRVADLLGVTIDDLLR